MVCTSFLSLYFFFKLRAQNNILWPQIVILRPQKIILWERFINLRPQKIYFFCGNDYLFISNFQMKSILASNFSARSWEAREVMSPEEAKQCELHVLKNLFLGISGIPVKSNMYTVSQIPQRAVGTRKQTVHRMFFFHVSFGLRLEEWPAAEKRTCTLSNFIRSKYSK